MIFVRALKEPKMFLMLSHADMEEMRAGHTKFVDEHHLKGETFNGVILSLHPTDHDSLQILKRMGYAGDLVKAEPMADEVECEGCKGVMRYYAVFMGKCIVCWHKQATEKK